MRRPHILSISAFLILLLSVALYQNCSEPIQSLGDDTLGSTCEDDGTCNPSIPATLGLVISATENGSEVFEIDLNQDYFSKLTGFAPGQDIYGCAQFYKGMDIWCPTNSYRVINGDSNFTYQNGIGRVHASACQLSNCTFFSHTTYFGSKLQVEYANSNFTKKIKKQVYIRPPHLSNDYNEVAIWYTDDSAGRNRIIHWLNGESLGGYLTSYISAGQPFYSHWFKPSSVATLQICLKQFTGNPPASPNGFCATGDWYNIVGTNTVVSANGKHHYNYNPDGFTPMRLIAFLRNGTTQQVYNHATTVVVIE